MRLVSALRACIRIGLAGALLLVVVYAGMIVGPLLGRMGEASRQENLGGILGAAIFIVLALVMCGIVGGVLVYHARWISRCLDRLARRDHP